MALIEEQQNNPLAIGSSLYRNHSDGTSNQLFLETDESGPH
jgi:hypothetical protein